MGFTLAEPFKWDHDELWVSALTHWLRIKWLVWDHTGTSVHVRVCADIYLCRHKRFARLPVHIHLAVCQCVCVCVANHFNLLSPAAHQPVHSSYLSPIRDNYVHYASSVCVFAFQRGIQYMCLWEFLCHGVWVWWWAFVDVCATLLAAV